MDPTEALKRIRGYLHSVDAIVNGPDEDTSVSVMVDTLEALRDQVRDLDEWLTKGGFLPDQWRTEEARKTERHIREALAVANSHDELATEIDETFG